MDPATTNLIATALVGAAPSAVNWMNYSLQKKADSKAYKRQVALLKMQQDWSERMSNTAHQREVADLREAGLNPILSAQGGSGASTPSVGASSVHSGDYSDTFDSPDFIGAAEGISRVNLNSATAKKTEFDSALADSQIETERAKQDYYDVQTAEKVLSLPTEKLKNAPAKFVIDKLAKDSPAAAGAVGGAGTLAAVAIASKLGKTAIQKALGMRKNVSPLGRTGAPKSTSAKQINRVSGRMPRYTGIKHVAPRGSARGTIAAPIGTSGARWFKKHPY